MKHRIIALWTHPRSVSTAMERIMIERGDLHVLHEPFSHLYYLHEKRGTAQAVTELPAETAEYDMIRKNMFQAAADQDVFLKDMAYHCLDHVISDDFFLEKIHHTFLIRNPKQAIESHYAMNPEVTSEEIGYEQLLTLFEKIKILQATTPLVIDADALKKNTEGVMRRYCANVGLEFMPDSLTWEPGQKKEWKTWAPWHKAAAESSGIQQKSRAYEVTIENNAHLRELYDHHLPFYEQMKAYCE